MTSYDLMNFPSFEDIANMCYFLCFTCAGIFFFITNYCSFVFQVYKEAICTFIHFEWNLILAVCYQLKQLKKQPEKNSGLNGIRTHGLDLTGAMLYPLSYQATWIDGQLWVRDIPDDSEICEYEYMKIIYVNCGWNMSEIWSSQCAINLNSWKSNLKIDHLSMWLGSSVDRALHRYRKVMGSNPVFFQVAFSTV